MRRLPEAAAGVCESEKSPNVGPLVTCDHEQLVILFGEGPSLLSGCKRWSQQRSYKISFADRYAWRKALNPESSIAQSIIIVGADFNDPNVILECRDQLLLNGPVRIIWLLPEKTCKDLCRADITALCKAINAERNSICACVTEEEFLSNTETILDSLNAGIVPVSETVYRAVFCSSSVDESRGQTPSGDIADALTDREVEVLRLAAKGLKQREIADVLERSVHTVSGYFKSAYAKLEVSTRTEAIFEAKALGYL